MGMANQAVNLDQSIESRKAVVAAFIWIIIPHILDAALFLYWIGVLDF